MLIISNANIFQTTPKGSHSAKKRGRPPKSSSHTELDSSTDESRSRHCKGDVSYTEAVDEVIEVISDTDSDDYVDIEEEEVVKRGRGRPPNSTKRKRGRPPLSETKKVKKSLSVSLFIQKAKQAYLCFSFLTHLMYTV